MQPKMDVSALLGPSVGPLPMALATLNVSVQLHPARE